MKCNCRGLNYIQPKSKWTSPPKATVVLCKKAVKPKNVIKIKLADNPKDIVIRFSDKETLVKSLRELLGT